MKQEKYLPIGSVVLLENGSKRVMITGYAVNTKEEVGKIYDYMGCLYPEGVITSDKNLVFNHEQIKDIYYIGYKDEEFTTFITAIKEMIGKIESGEVNLSEIQKEVMQQNSQE